MTRRDCLKSVAAAAGALTLRSPLFAGEDLGPDAPSYTRSNCTVTRTLWADTFEESPQRVFALEDAVAERIAGSMSIGLSGEQRKRMVRQQTDDAAAYQLYLRGRYFWNKHFSMNTFTGNDYETGAAPASTYNPTHLDVLEPGH